MYIQYSVVYDSSELFSIKFEGIYNNKSSINPMNYFNTLNIDMTNGKPIVISDLYNINSDFIDLIQKNFNEQMLDWIDDTKANLPNAVEMCIRDRAECPYIYEGQEFSGPSLSVGASLYLIICLLYTSRCV